MKMNNVNTGGIKDHVIETIKLSYPVIIGQAGVIMMGVVDNLLVGGLGATSLAAASVANSLFILIFILGIGVCTSITPLTAIAVGAGKENECDTIFTQGHIVNIVVSTLLMLVTYFAADFFYLLGQSPDVIKQAAPYTKILALSMIPVLIFQTNKQFIEGFSVVKPGMVITITANIINGLVGWILIYGKFGAPRLGLNGAGIATFSSRMFMALTITIYIFSSAKFKKLNLTLRVKKINYVIIKKILSLGVPSAVQYFFEVGAFSTAAIMVGWLGVAQLASHQIALNLASISFMCTLGISTAGSIRVANGVGRKDTTEIRRAGFTAIVLGEILMASFGVVFIVFRNQLPAFYIHDPSVISIASSLLIIAALFQVFDGTQAVGIGILRGLTDVKGPTIITFIAYWIIGLPVGYLLGFNFKLGVQGVWIGLMSGLITSAVLLTLRFNHKSKQRVVF
jgi:MATE family multidrug resistance protein